MFKYLKRQYHSENRLLWGIGFSWLPIVYLYTGYAASFSDLDFFVGLLGICGFYGPTIWYLRRTLRRPLLTLSNLLLSMQEGDYGLRARQYHGLIGDVLSQTNDLAGILKALRIGEREAHLLLSKMIAAIDLAVFIFDQRDRLTLANPEAEKLMLQTEAQLQGVNATTLALDGLGAMDGEVVQRQFPGAVGRWRIRHFVFYQDGQEHQLLAISDVGKLLVEEERQNWQKLLRVLSHELNNSLVPIKNMAQTLESIMGKAPPGEMVDDVQGGLRLIGKRADSLHRFIQGYARLARLPPPKLRRVRICDLVARATELDNLTRVEINPGPDAYILADSDQTDQVMLNLMSNALDATEENGGNICISWRLSGKYARLDIEDYGTGIATVDNLFVPFFTTKTNGSGIGLVLCKQIAESHQGQLQLNPATHHEGCVATLLLPLAD